MTDHDPHETADDDSDPNEVIPITPEAQARIDRMLRDFRKVVAVPDFAELPALKSMREQQARFAAAMAATQRQADETAARRNSILQREQKAAAAAAAHRAQERQRELDWQEGVLEQQRLTVEALTALNKSQNDDRRINVSVLRVAAATLVVGVIAVIVTVLVA